MPLFDAVTSAPSNSFSHTLSGSDRYLFVVVDSQYNGSGNVTVNGVLMTLLWSSSAVGDGGIKVWGMVNPPEGTVTIAVAGSPDGIVAISYKNVNQIDPLETASTTTGTNTSTSLTPVFSPAGLAVSFLSRPGAYTTFNQQARGSDGGTWKSHAGDAQGVDTPTFTWTFSNDWYYHYAVTLKPSPQSGTSASPIDENGAAI